MTIQEMLEHAPDHLLNMLDVRSISSKAELLDKCNRECQEFCVNEFTL